MAKYSTYLKDFLWENRDLLNNNDFTELYERAGNDVDIMAGELTNALYTAGIHPLVYMDHIPESFLENITLHKRSFTLPDNITEIERSAFSNCNIKEIKISENSKLKFIDEFAFAWSSLSEIYLPKSISAIRYKAFHDVDNLHVIYEGSADELDFICDGDMSLIFPANATYTFLNK